MRAQALAAPLLALAAAALIAARPALAAPKHAPAKPAAAAPKADAAPAPTAAPGDAPAGAPAPMGDAAADMRCIVVAGALLQSDDEQMKSLGRASLFYYLGRLQGRGDTANLDARVIAEADKMTESDLKTQSKTCGGAFTGAAQALQELSEAFEKHFAPPGGAAPKK
jgi:hypothetical protein